MTASCCETHSLEWGNYVPVHLPQENISQVISQCKENKVVYPEINCLKNIINNKNLTYYLGFVVWTEKVFRLELFSNPCFWKPTPCKTILEQLTTQWACKTADARLPFPPFHLPSQTYLLSTYLSTFKKEGIKKNPVTSLLKGSKQDFSS